MITAVLTPITSPSEDTSGPPELPGLSAASVWMTSSIMRPFRELSERPSAETITGGHAGVEAQRIADRDHQLAAPQRLGIAQARRRQGHVFLDAGEREIRIEIAAEDARGKPAALHRRNVRGPGGVDDMRVGDDEAVGRDQEPRSRAQTPAVRAPRIEPDNARSDRIDNGGHGLGIGVKQHAFLRAALLRGRMVRRLLVVPAR